MDPERLAVHCIACLGQGGVWRQTELQEERARGLEIVAQERKSVVQSTLQN